MRQLHWPLLAAAGLLALSGCNSGQRPPLAATPVTVTVARPEIGKVRDSIVLDGIVAPSVSVNLMARVAGTLQSAPFHDGDSVQKGQQLFVIEPEPYVQQVKLNQAHLEQARAEATRQQELLAENATSKSSLENAVSVMKQAEANLALAQINLGYTDVRAPFNGVIGRRDVDVGNYVGASPGGTVLATVLQLRPAFVNFSINERDLLRIRTRLPQKPGSPKPGVGVLKVRAALQGELAPSEEGILDFADNSVGSTTGSLQLRATFPNSKLRLIPGLYAKLTIDIGNDRQAVLIPSVAIQADQEGSFVYLVGDGTRVERRSVVLGGVFDGKTEVAQGLAPSDNVIVGGISNVGVGQVVSAHAELRSDPTRLAAWK